MGPALFVFAHPDDETLCAGTTIAKHVAAGQAVYILTLTDGRASNVINYLNGASISGYWGVRHNPPNELYEPLGPDEFGEARMAECRAAVYALSEAATPPALFMGNLPDGGVTVSTAAGSITAVADLIAPNGPVRIKTHSPVVDDHPDHVAAGLAALQLRRNDPERFSDVRHYVLPAYWMDVRLGQVSKSWDLPSDAQISNRARNACRAYGAWHPPHSYAVGYHSVRAMFAQVENSPRSMVHPPVEGT